MSPNHNARISKTLNQAKNLTHPYLQAQGQPATPSPYAHIQAPGGQFQSINFFPPTQDSISATNQAKVVKNEDEVLP
ncbi:hypothetical protein CROQUDRAFT_101994 [Cronartium quercuum f. sp. fusiforme G11]|uniref:Uncharacterized protein n=1 Tax=Cronartium quercuum f. sp. fusiforme G11 TaxID=708437 RepID=A0A9P6T698_9BASI|nr:hypothetical protein CROQUDRAFT_101994 [Cronartium quercuum f. sp. fusiforme G11]